MVFIYNKNMNDFLKLIEKIKFKAPLTTQQGSFKYPYKPALVLAMAYNFDSPNEFFNQPIYFDKDSKIIKTYYDLIFSFSIAFEKISSKYPHLAFFHDSKTVKWLIDSIKNNPGEKLKVNNSNIWVMNKKECFIQININEINQEILSKYFQKLKQVAWEQLLSSCPDYNKMKIEEILNTKMYLNEVVNYHSEIINEDEQINAGRKFQHIFKKCIYERDQKCKICCSTNSHCLEAAHIKPYSKCDSLNDKYDVNNGITLCANHHKLLDNGMFTFNDDWTVIISPHYHEDDEDLKIKTFEPCYVNNFDDMSPNNKYAKFHREHIFKY